MLHEPLSQDAPLPVVFKVSPLVWLALWTLYIALMLPMPFLIKPEGLSDNFFVGLAIAFVGGGILLQMALSERVRLDETGIAVIYPGWVLPFLRRDWALDWSEVVSLKARSTGQGGLVYYLVTPEGKGFLLPMRIVGFTRMLRIIHQRTGVDIQGVKPLAQPWMYGTLLGVALLLAIADLWVIETALTQAPTF